MTVQPAENSFHRGIASLNAGDRLAAAAYFEAALRLDRQYHPHRPSMKYLSYFGLCLAFATNRQEEAVRLCRQAARSEFYNPDVYWNLGRVALLQGNRREAHQAFLQGLAIDKAHAGLRFQIRRLGVRRPPVLPFLSRHHTLNRWAGRMWTQLRR